MANDLVNCDDLYRPAIDSILNKIIISTNLNSALKHSQLINSKYRIYTLDGDYLAPSGAMTGGYQRRKLSTINWEEKKKTYQKELEEIAETVRIQEKTCNELINTKRDNQANLEPKKQQLLTLKIKIENLDEKLKTYQNDLKQYDYSTTNPKKQQDQLIYWASELVKYEKLLQEKKGQIATTNHLKEQYRLAIQSSEQKLKEINSNYAKEAKALKELELMEARLKTLVENDINNLTQKYEITLDYAIETFNTDLEMSLEEARELIKDLNDELHKFGNVNLKAAEELKKREIEHAEKKELYDKIAKACNDLAVVIKQLDHKAISQFSQVIKEANQRLPKIFQYLFGGGSCEIVYEDPENILTSGIEIKTHLPGKTVTKLMLFSGGEKTLIALAVLLAVLQTSTIPLVILDEAESALDPANVERFGNIILKNSDKTQFIIITHRPGTMQQCEILYGVTMARNGVSIMIPIQLKEATKYIQKEQQ